MFASQGKTALSKLYVTNMLAKAAVGGMAKEGQQDLLIDCMGGNQCSRMCWQR